MNQKEIKKEKITVSKNQLDKLLPVIFEYHPYLNNDIPFTIDGMFYTSITFIYMGSKVSFDIHDFVKEYGDYELRKLFYIL